MNWIEDKLLKQTNNIKEYYIKREIEFEKSEINESKKKIKTFKKLLKKLDTVTIKENAITWITKEKF